MYLTASGPVRKKEIQTRDQMGKIFRKTIYRREMTNQEYHIKELICKNMLSRRDQLQATQGY